MRSLLKSTVAAAVLSATAFTLAPSAASAGVMGLTDQQSVAPAPKTEKAWYCRRHYRHWGYCGTCGARYYGYAYPSTYGYGYPGYYGYANPVGAAAAAVTWPFWGWW